MPAQLKVYTDSGHSSEVAHTTANGTTLNGAVSAGAASIIVTSTTGWPSQGFIDIVDGTNGNETIPYTSISGTTVNLAKVTASAHASGLTVNQWVYVLAVGDQTNGILNDGSNASPNGTTNVGTWYLYNAGDQVAQSPSIATSNTSPSTTSGYSDTVVSITSASTGFGTSVSPSNINAGSQQQFWVAAQIPSGQSGINNPQQCVINISYSSI
jgi:hypothetical protein